MAHFQQVVLDYLETHKPEEVRRLQRERQLRAYMESLVEQLYSETGRTLHLLQNKFPNKPEEYLTLYAEELAIAAVLPVPLEPVTGDQEGEKPSSRMRAITSIGRLAEPSRRTNMCEGRR